MSGKPPAYAKLRTGFAAFKTWLGRLQARRGSRESHAAERLSLMQSDVAQVDDGVWEPCADAAAGDPASAAAAGVPGYDTSSSGDGATVPGATGSDSPIIITEGGIQCQLPLNYSGVQVGRGGRRHHLGRGQGDRQERGQVLLTVYHASPKDALLCGMHAGGGLRQHRRCVSVLGHGDGCVGGVPLRPAAGAGKHARR